MRRKETPDMQINVEEEEEEDEEEEEEEEETDGKTSDCKS